jgi:spermidine synthase
MSRAYLKLVSAAVWLGALLPALAVVCSPIDPDAQRRAVRLGVEPWTPARQWLEAGALGIAGAAVGAIAWWALIRRGRWLDGPAEAQARWCDALPARRVGPAIVAAAGLSLLLELAVIRWQGAVFELFSYYKNLSLLACFLGLGLGYALARRAHLMLMLTAPLLAFQMALLVLTRHGLPPDRRASLAGLPVREQLAMGVPVTQSWPEYLAVYWFLTAVFLLTALAFVPVGQLCGRLMDRVLNSEETRHETRDTRHDPRPTPLRNYGANLIGSVLGVGAMFVFGAWYLPPAAWFAVGLGGLVLFQAAHRVALAVALVGTLAAEVVLTWPVAVGWEAVYSPYQLIERGPGEHGLSLLRAAGQYYQRIHDLSEAVTSTTRDEGIRATAAHYDFPYRAFGRPPGAVAVVGAGTGNDVAAALRAGARRVEAVEIDPVIVAMGRLYHPEAPYADPRTHVVIDDARAFLRGGDDSYEMIVYGLLDSHTLLSHAANVRLDSFVYTVEGLREARARLRPGGLLALSFSVISPELGRKIYLMLQEAFDGRPPCAVRGRFNYDGSVIFLQAEDVDLDLSDDLLQEHGFFDVTERYADPRVPADVSTDDWPFFYMPRRAYPVSYLGMVALILALGALLLTMLRVPALPTSDVPRAPRRAQAAFFLLGAGFMLVQTKGITELGLAFGNTWQVVGLVIAGMLGFAFLANLAVARLGLRDARPALVLVVASLALGLYVARAGGLPPTPGGRLGTLALLTGPVFFAGLAFSALFGAAGDPSRALAANLFGALGGGLLESTAMAQGMQFLYVLAMILYGLALLCAFGIGRPRRAAEAPA